MTPLPFRVEPEVRVDNESGGASATGRLEEMATQYGHVIRVAVRRAGGDRLGVHAEDVEQSVLLEVWKQVRSERDINYPSSYFYRAAIRETVRLMKRSQSRQEEALQDEETTTRQHISPGRQACAVELRQAIDSGLGGLHPARRQAVEAHLSGDSVQDIMRQNEWSYSRARNLIARGMADLRSRLRALGVSR